MQDVAGDRVMLENCDDQGYGYLRTRVTMKQLRIEYYPAGDGATAKTSDDSVTIDLATRRIAHFNARHSSKQGQRLGRAVRTGSLRVKAGRGRPQGPNPAGLGCLGRTSHPTTSHRILVPGAATRAQRPLRPAGSGRPLGLRVRALARLMAHSILSATWTG